jgi:hypothetical protein
VPTPTPVPVPVPVANPAVTAMIANAGGLLTRVTAEYAATEVLLTRLLTDLRALQP